MSSRMFQNVITQMKDAIDRPVGVADERGFVIACSDLALVGSRLNDYSYVEFSGNAVVKTEGRCYCPLTSDTSQIDYVAFAEGTDEQSATICSLCAVAFNESKLSYDEKHNKSAFLKNIISDNILPGDVYVRAKELHFVTDDPRCVILVRMLNNQDVAAVERIQRLFDEGVVSEQKRDEVYAQYKAMEAQMQAAQSQYDMAVNGARREDKLAAAAQVGRAKGAVQEVNSYIHETVQIAQMEGEVMDIYPKQGELVGTGSPIMTIAVMKDMWGTFSVREDQLADMKVGDTFTAFVPAFNKDIQLKVYSLKDEGSYAVWRATKANGQYDLKTFEVKARPVEKFEGLRPGMSLVIKN